MPVLVVRADAESRSVFGNLVTDPVTLSVDWPETTGHERRRAQGTEGIIRIYQRREDVIREDVIREEVIREEVIREEVIREEKRREEKRRGYKRSKEKRRDEKREKTL